MCGVSPDMMEIVLNYFNVNKEELSKHIIKSNDTNSTRLLATVSSVTIDQNCFHAGSLYPVNGSNLDYLNELFKEKFNNASVIISVVILILINFVVIAGNILVILSVFASTKLRTVTNFFIVSLAVADLLVGIAVLPYSLTLEILDTWIFGEIWCQGWLVIDVWMCTASILNLCAISVDRYLAVTQPVRYRTLMTAKRAKIIIAAVWIMSFIICFPPLVVRTKDTTFMSRNNMQPVNSHNTYQLPSIFLESSSDVNANTTNSFVDMTLHDPTNTSKLLNGLKQSSNNDYVVVGSDTLLDSPLLRTSTNHSKTQIYLKSTSNSSTIPCKIQPVQCALFSNKNYVIYSAFGSFYIPMFVMIFFYWRIYLVAIRTSRALKRGYRTTKTTGDGTSEERLTLRIHRGYVTDDNFGEKDTTLEQESQPKKLSRSDIKSHSMRQKTQIPINIYKASRKNKSNLTVQTDYGDVTSVKCDTLLPDGMVQLNGKNRRNSPGCQSTLSLPSSSSPSSSRQGSAKSNKVVLARLSKRTSKYQAKRFHAETKAAKTVGIIVGGFIVCWLPFFTTYLTRAFCQDCIPKLLFSIFFWLGYCNSMINPCIYGLFSRDFRRAFRNILCRCKFREETSVSSLIRQIHMPTFFEDEEMAKHESQDY